MKIIKYICFGLLITVLASCEDYLKPKVTNEFGDDITWKLPDYAMGLLGEVYAGINQLTCGYNGNNFLDAVTDNSLTTHTASTLYQYIYGSQSMHSDPIGVWDAAYNNIARVNLFLKKGLTDDIIYKISDPLISENLKKRIIGETYFLRAWWQMELLRTYGGLSKDGRALGYIIVTDKDDFDDSERMNHLPRNTFEECVEQIFNDCDTAIAYLPLQYLPGNDEALGIVQNYGRATGKAAWALKSRVALLAASPAYQPGGISDNEKWLRAARIAQEAITAVNSDAANTMIPLSNDLLVGQNVNSDNHVNSQCEILFRRFVNGNGMETNHFPSAWHGNAKCNPSQNLVNAYPMANGYPITHPKSGYDAQEPYAKRDTRFSLTINYNGNKFMGVDRELEIYSAAADGSTGRDAPGYEYRNTWTGYHLRKGLSEVTTSLYNPENIGQTQGQPHANPLLRRAEIWFNLAEACNELAGPNGIAPGVDAENTASSIIRRIRNLYGTGNDYVNELAAQNDKETFRELILNERRLEFAFENMRFWDIRRCRLPLNTPILGIKIYKDVDNRYFYFGTSPGEDDIMVQDRSALSDAKYYTSPIPYAELVKNKNLVQNAGWE